MNYGQNKQYVPTIWWGFACFVVVGLGAVYAVLDWSKTMPDKGDAALRPYMGVSGVQKTMEIGKPVSIVITFTNGGKTPANNAEIRGRLNKIPIGEPLNRNYEGKDFELVAPETVIPDHSMKAEFLSRDNKSTDLLTLHDVMQLTTDLTYRLVAHGVVRYYSPHIAGGVDELRFCYEFDYLTSQMVVCQVPRNKEKS